MLKKLIWFLGLLVITGSLIMQQNRPVQAAPATTQTAIKQAQDQLSKLNNDIGNLTVSADQLKQQQQAKQAQVTATQKDLTQTNTAYEQQVQIIEKNLQQMQTKDSSFSLTWFDNLLDSQSLTDLLQRNRILDQLMTAKVSNAQATQALAQKITTQKATLQTQQAALNQVAQKNAATLKTLNQQKSVANQQLKALQQQYQHELAAQAKAAQAANQAGLGMLSENQQLLNNAIVKSTVKYIGVPYVWGGTSPQGFDCSGLVQYVFAQNKQKLPRTSQEQSKLGQSVALKDLKPADLLFWGTVGTAHHVAIYIGNGYFIQAPQPGDHVRVTKLTDYMPDFAKRISEPQESSTNK